MNSDDLVRRLANVLVQLEFLSEAKAAKSPDSKLASQHPESSPPASLMGPSEYQFHYESIERMVAGAERGVEIARRKEKQEPESKEQFRFRVIEQYEGFSPQHVADKESLTLSLVYKIRQEAGRTPDKGKLPG